MSRATTESGSVGRLRQSTGGCYKSQETKQISVAQSASAVPYITPTGTEKPSGSGWKLGTDRFDENTHQALIERLRAAADAVTAAIVTDLPDSLQDQITE